MREPRYSLVQIIGAMALGSLATVVAMLPLRYDAPRVVWSIEAQFPANVEAADKFFMGVRHNGVAAMRNAERDQPATFEGRLTQKAR